MPRERQDGDDTPEDEQSIGEESDEFVPADTTEDTSQDEEPADVEPSDESPKDDDGEPAEADDAESEDSETDAEESEDSEAEVEDVDETPEEAAEAEKSQKGPDEVFCTSCGEPIKKQAEVCPHCGVRQEQDAGSVSEKDPLVAGVASIIFPGAGQLYNGQVGRGVAAFLGVVIADTILILLGATLIWILIGALFFLLIPLVHLVVAYDAYDQAQKINSGEVVP